MKGIFEGTDALISKALFLASGKSIKQKSTCLALKASPELNSSIEALVFDIFQRIEGNWIGRIPSAKNWQLRNETGIASHNASKEILLERAISILGKRKLIKGWFNQIPIASGLIDEISNKRAAVDLIRVGSDQADLIELKWDSDNPVYAAFEITRYGLVFLLCLQNRESFKYSSFDLMKVSKLSLQVLAPKEFYSGYSLEFIRVALEQGLQKLFMEKTNGSLDINFQFLAFPKGFVLPFHTGKEVSELEHLPESSFPIANLLDAISNIQLVWEVDSQ